MKQVTSKEFYAKIGPLDVVLSVQGNYPYKTLFKLRNGTLVGIAQERDFPLGVDDYFLA